MLWIWILSGFMGIALLALGIYVIHRGDVAQTDITFADKSFKSGSVGVTLIVLAICVAFIPPWIYAAGQNKGEKVSAANIPRAPTESANQKSSSSTSSPSSPLTPVPTSSQSGTSAIVGDTSTTANAVPNKGQTSSAGAAINPDTSGVLAKSGPWVGVENDVEVVVEKCQKDAQRNGQLGCVVRIEMVPRMPSRGPREAQR